MKGNYQKGKAFEPNQVQISNSKTVIGYSFKDDNQIQYKEKHLKIWSSSKYCLRAFVKAAEDSESRPKGFSTMTLVQPFAADAERLAHFTASIKIFGGSDK